MYYDGDWYESVAVIPDPTPEPEPQAVTIYFVNSSNYNTPYAYVWDNNNNGYNAWPGEAMTLTEETATSENIPVYSYTFPEQYIKCKFTDNGENGKDLNIDVANPYYDPSSDTWYASAANVPDPVYCTFYYVNTGKWESVNIYAWNGVTMSWPGVAMTKESEQIFGFDVYSYTTLQGSFANCKFNCGDSYQTSDLVVEEGKYNCYKGKWYASFDELVPALAGDFNEWEGSAKQFVFDLETGIGTTTVTMLQFNHDYEFKVIDGAWLSNTGTMTEDNCTNWTMSADVTDNCKITTKGVGDYVFTYNLNNNKLSVTYNYETGYDLILNGTTVIPLTKQSDKDEYYALDLYLKAEDKYKFFNKYTGVEFTADAMEHSSDLKDVFTFDKETYGIGLKQPAIINTYLKLEDGGNSVWNEGYAVLSDQFENEPFLEKKIEVGEKLSLVVDRPMSAGKYNTLCLPFSLDSDELANYFPGAVVAQLSYAEVSGVGPSRSTNLHFTIVDNIDAGMPYIIEVADDITDPIVFDDVLIEQSEGQILYGDVINAVGVIDGELLQEYDYDCLFLMNNKLYWPDETGYMKGMRSFFVVNPSASAQSLGLNSLGELRSFPALMSIEEPNDEITGATEIKVSDSDSVYKIIENDEVIIVRNGVKYDLMGRITIL